MSSPHQLDERARSGFRQAFGYLPGAVAVAPGRINIIGEHTDYNQGFVLPAAIDRHVSVALRLRRDARLALRSDRYRAPVDLDKLPARRQGDCADYVVGGARKIDLRHNTGPGFDASVASDLPVGSGLASSGPLDAATRAAFMTDRCTEI